MSKNSISFTNITAAIEEEAALEAKKILDEANTSFEAKRSSVVLQAKEEADKIVDLAKQEAARIYRSTVDGATAANIAAHKKQEDELLELLRTSVLQQLLDMSAKDYLNMVVGVICKHAQDGDAIVAGEDDTRVSEKLVQAIGERFNLKISMFKERGKFSGGIIIKSYKNNKQVEQDYTFEGIISSIISQHKDKMLRYLGGNGKL